jgi:hypothetical protein
MYGDKGVVSVLGGEVQTIVERHLHRRDMGNISNVGASLSLVHYPFETPLGAWSYSAR